MIYSGLERSGVINSSALSFHPSQFRLAERAGMGERWRWKCNSCEHRQCVKQPMRCLPATVQWYDGSQWQTWHRHFWLVLSEYNGSFQYNAVLSITQLAWTVAPSCHLIMRLRWVQRVSVTVWYSCHSCMSRCCWMTRLRGWHGLRSAWHSRAMSTIRWRLDLGCQLLARLSQDLTHHHFRLIHYHTVSQYFLTGLWLYFVWFLQHRRERPRHWLDVVCNAVQCIME